MKRDGVVRCGEGRNKEQQAHYITEEAASEAPHEALIV
jgi:hypothetical protein